MVKEIQKEDKVLFQCEACNFFFEEKHWAEKCEVWCTEKKSCNLDISKHAVEG